MFEFLKNLVSRKQNRVQKRVDNTSSDYRLTRRGATYDDCIANRRTLYDRLELDPCPRLNVYNKLWHLSGTAKKVIRFKTNSAFEKKAVVFDVNNNGDLVGDSDFARAANGMMHSSKGKANLNLHQKNINLLATMQEATVLSGIGDYGAMLLLFDDTGDLGRPIDYTRINTLLEAIPLSASEARGNAQDGYPDYYQPYKNGIDYKIVHPSRIIHITDNGQSRHTPRMEGLLHNVTAVIDTALASWVDTTAQTPKTMLNFSSIFQTNSENGVSLRAEEITGFISGFTKQARMAANEVDPVIVANGAVEFLKAVFSDPGPRGEYHQRLIATAMDIPYRKWEGSEQGKYASGQDMTSYENHIIGIRNNVVTPNVIMPTISRLIAANALPRPINAELEYNVQWSINLGELIFELNGLFDLRVKAGGTQHELNIDELITQQLTKTKLME